jgi:lipoprotein-anchoring transpeptidase ErfK/SrfK
VRWTPRDVLLAFMAVAIVVAAVSLGTGLIPGVMMDSSIAHGLFIAGSTAATASPEWTATATTESERDEALTPTPKLQPTTIPSASPTRILPTPSPTRSSVDRQSSASPMTTDTVPASVVTTPQLTPTPTVIKSNRFLLVDQDEQMMHVFEDDLEVRVIPVSTGMPVANAFTPAWTGKVGPFWGRAAFRNTNLWADYIWYLFPGAEGSILIHSVPYTRDGEEKVYDRLEALGVEPASRGCIRISPEDASWLRTWDPVGVAIEITPWSGTIGPADESL